MTLRKDVITRMIVSATDQDTSEPLKCSPCQKKKKKVMMHEDWYQEVTESQARSSHTNKEQKYNLVSVTAQEEARQRIRVWDLYTMQSCQVKYLAVRKMLPRSLACRHYSILWDSPVIIDGILCKKSLKHDGSGKYLNS